MMSDRLENKKVTLEEVLRLKRAERPDPVFWAEFEQQLRAKQLAAIVERRPWWHLDLLRVSSGISRLRVPLGATAVLALTIVTVHEFRWSNSVSEVLAPGHEDVSSDEIAQADLPGVPTRASNSTSTFDGAAIVASSHPSQLADSESMEPSPSTRVASGSGSNSMLLWLDEMSADLGDRWAHASSDLDVQFTALRSSPLALDDSIPATARGFGSLRQDRRSDDLVEPLTQVTAPSEPRRARLAALVAPASMKSTSRASSPDRVRERMISRLSEDELYNSASRLGVAKGGLRLSF